MEFEHQVFLWKNREDDKHTLEQSKRIQDIKNNFIKIDAFMKKVKKMSKETMIFIRQMHDKENEISIGLK